MATPFDVTTKRLLDLRPRDWLAFLGLPDGPVTPLDSDLSTISRAADRLLRVDALMAFVLHVEFVSGKDGATMPFRALVYSVNAEAKTGLPVVSILFLLHRRADSPAITGEFTRTGPDGRVRHVFRYDVVRVWREDPERFLAGGLGLLPFAPIAKASKEQLPAIVERMEARIDAEVADDREAGDLLTAAYILAGLRYNKADRELARQLFRRVRRMKESVTYQMIVEEGEEKGRVEGEVRALLRFGRKRLGEPSPRVVAALKAITSVEKLEALIDRLDNVESWDELLK